MGCGIAGIIGPTISSTTEVNRMLESIKYRGLYTESMSGKGFSMGCRRLPIIDEAGGKQPKVSTNGRYYLVQNGEIYNYVELRDLLKPFGPDFQTNSDTEVLLRGYEFWGNELFSKLNGMYAIAIWDDVKKKLILARDHAGIKPIWYYKDHDNIIFASEYKAILASGLVGPLAINTDALSQYIEIGYTLSPITLFSDIKGLYPGTYTILTNGMEHIRHHWTYPEINMGAPHPTIYSIRNNIENSIRMQTMTSDVDVAAYLSGGLDSSTIVAFASKIRPIKTFCMGFGRPDDELEGAKKVADHFGTKHYGIILDQTDMLKEYPEMVWHCEAPKLNLYTWYVHQAAAKEARVCLSGLGGDEVFYGYHGMRRFIRGDDYIRTGLMAGEKLSGKDAYASLITGLKLNGTWTRDHKHNPPYDEQHDFLQNMVINEYNTKLPYDYLHVEDSMSMAHTMEVRVPLLDINLVTQMLAVPYTQQRSDVGKLLLREAIKDDLPEFVLKKPKRGFGIQAQNWWPTVREYAEKYIPDSKVLMKYSPTWYDRIMERLSAPDDPQRNSVWYKKAWSMLGFIIWYEEYVNGSKPVWP